MKIATTPRWAISFADLALLLLGCFVMLHAMRPPVSPEHSSETPAARQIADLAANELFEPGEARLTAEGRARLEAIPREIPVRDLVLVSRGAAPGGNRMDSFELAAARAAAVGRALGVAPDRLSISLDDPSPRAGGQRISLRADR